MPTVYIIAGCNGAGKTTFANRYLPKCSERIEFVNADMIAKGLSPFNPAAFALEAGKIMLNRLRELSSCNADFGLETTLSGRTYLLRFREWRAQGYFLKLFFLWIQSPAEARLRIDERVKKKGHDIQQATVQRRYVRGLANLFEVYWDEVDEIYILDNSNLFPNVVASRQAGESLSIYDSVVFSKMKSLGVSR